MRKKGICKPPIRVEIDMPAPKRKLQEGGPTSIAKKKKGNDGTPSEQPTTKDLIIALPTGCFVDRPTTMKLCIWHILC